MKVMTEENQRGMHDAGPELQHQDPEQEEAHRPAQKYRQDKMSDAHFRNGGSERENLERHRRGKHGRKHQAPKRVLLESSVQFFKTLRGHTLTQQLFTPCITDSVNNQTADGGARSRHQNVQQEARMVLRHVTS